MSLSRLTSPPARSSAGAMGDRCIESSAIVVASACIGQRRRGMRAAVARAAPLATFAALAAVFVVGSRAWVGVAVGSSLCSGRSQQVRFRTCLAAIVGEGAAEGGQTSGASSTDTTEADSPPSPRGVGAGRIGGRMPSATSRQAQSPPQQRTPTPRQPEAEGEGPLGLVKTVGAVLLALVLGRAALDFAFGDEEQDTYYVSSRSMISVTTYDENGQRQTSIKEDSDVRTNIPGLKAGSRSGSAIVPPSSYLGLFD